MKVYLRQDIEKVGLAGEILKVTDGYARNFLFPRALAIEINQHNEKFYAGKAKTVEHRKEVVAHKTSMLAEKIKNTKIIIKKKMHDDGQLYGAINTKEIMEALEQQGVSVSKNQILLDKSIKTKGTHHVTLRLTSRLTPELTVVVVPEK